RARRRPAAPLRFRRCPSQPVPWQICSELPVHVAAEAIDGEILLDLDDEIGVDEPHLVAGGGPEHVGIDATFDFRAHSELLASLTVSSNMRSSVALPPRQPATTCSAQST